MKVEDLIEQLKKFDPKKDVVFGAIAYGGSLDLDIVNVYPWLYDNGVDVVKLT